MKKTDKKIISLFLVIIILISQCGTIFAVDIPITGGGEFTLEEYLIENEVDTNEDGVLSEEEWKGVKNLVLNGQYITDLEGIKNAINLETLYIENIDIAGIEFPNLINLKNLTIINVNNLNSIDFSKMEKLSHLYCNGINDLSNIDFSNLHNLEDLTIYDGNNVNWNSISNLELKTLNIHDCDLSEIDFSKFYNVKSLNLIYWNTSFENQVDLDLSGMNTLENLYVRDISPYYWEYDYETGTQTFEYVGGNYINSLDISKLSNLNSLCLENTYLCNIEYPDFTNIESIYVDTDKTDMIDLTTLKNCISATFASISNNFEENNIKINENMIVGGYSKYGYNVIDIRKKENIEIAKNGIIEKEYDLGSGVTVNLENSNILEEKENDIIIAKEVGEEEINITDFFGNEHKILVTVFENINDTTLEQTGVTAEFTSNRYDEYQKILKSNGELWQINSKTTAEIIDTNVKKHVAGYVYSNKTLTLLETNIENTLYKNNKLKINYENDNLKEIDNVKDVGLNTYITSENELYGIYVNSIIEECQTKKLMDNVKKIVGRDYIVKEDGTTWRRNTENDSWAINYNIEFEKIFDFEIKDVTETYKKDEHGTWCRVEILTDVNNTLWINWEDSWRQVNDNDIFEKQQEGWYLSISKEKTVHFTEDSSGSHDFREEEFILNSPLILTDVEDCKNDILIRTDGSIWIYDIKNGLTKIIKSTPSADEEIPELPKEPEIIVNPEINNKKIGQKECITGIKLNEDDRVTVNEFINQNIFNNQYTVKLKDINGDELKSDSLVGTGTKVELYQGDVLVKEYTIIIYGDIDSDAEITPADALTLIKIVNKKIEAQSEANIEAGKVSGQDEISAIDSLTIIKHLNKRYEISQDI